MITNGVVGYGQHDPFVRDLRIKLSGFVMRSKVSWMEETTPSRTLSHELLFEVMSIQENEPGDLFSFMLYDAKQLALFNPESLSRALRDDNFSRGCHRHWIDLLNRANVGSNDVFTSRPIIRF